MSGDLQDTLTLQHLLDNLTEFGLYNFVRVSVGVRFLSFGRAECFHKVPLSNKPIPAPIKPPKYEIEFFPGQLRNLLNVFHHGIYRDIGALSSQLVKNLLALL